MENTGPATIVAGLRVFMCMLIWPSISSLEKAVHMTNHASFRTTQLYDRRWNEISTDEVERILI